MKELKELLNGQRVIKIVVEPEDFEEFLHYAKSQGCLWNDGSIINPKKLLKANYTKTIIVTADYLIRQAYGWMLLMSLQNKPRYLFKDLKIEECSKVDVKKTKRTEKLDKEYELIKEAQAIAYKKRCEENRKISQLQLKYQNITNKLQKQFFVRYENDDELLRLFILFRECGYENIFDISLDNFNKNPKVICVDNENMTYEPTSLKCCECALMANKKIYKTEDFEKIFKDIFKE